MAAAVTAQLRAAFGDVVPRPAGSLAHVALTNGMFRDMVAGRLDDVARYIFTNGQCHAMAFALTIHTGWPLVWLGDPECVYDTDCAEFPERWGWCGCQVSHIAALTPGDLLLDVDGPRTREEHAVEYDDGMTVRVLDMHCLTWILSASTWRAPELALAFSVLDEVLTPH